MPESSVKITLGVQLDKSEIDKQLQEMQKELDAYKLKIGVDREQLVQDSGTQQSPDKSSAKSFETSGNEEEIDFGPLSELANDKFNQVASGFETVNNNLVGIFDEIKDINSTLKGLFPDESNTEQKSSGGASISSNGSTDELKNIGDKLLDQLIGLSSLVATIANSLENKDSKNIDKNNLNTETEPQNSVDRFKSSNTISEQQSPTNSTGSGIETTVQSFNKLIDSIGNPGEVIQQIVDIATDLSKQLISQTTDILTSLNDNIVKIVTDSLKDSLENIQEGVLKLLGTNLESLVSSLLDSISGGSKQQSTSKNNDADSANNIAGAISSGATSIISVLSQLQNSIFDLVSPIVGQLLPAVIQQLEFDFFKTLIGGAVQQLGSAIIAQPAGGAAKLAGEVITGNIFRQADPATAATMAFGEGFAASDPTSLSAEISKISKKLDVFNPAIAEPVAQAQLNPSSEIETVQMTAVLENIAGNIAASKTQAQLNPSSGIKTVQMTAVLENIAGNILTSNIILEKIEGAIDAGNKKASNKKTNEQRLLEGTAEIIKMTAVLESAVDGINTTNQLAEEILTEVSLISFGNEKQPLLSGSNDNSLPSDSDYTDVSFEDIIAQIVPSTPIEIPDVNPDNLVNNFTRIIQDVFDEIGISIQEVAKTKKIPKLEVDPSLDANTKDEFKIGSKYNRKKNTISVSETTAQGLSSENNISKDSFISIVRELRKAIQGEFTSQDYQVKQNRAKRQKAFTSVGVRIPLLKQDDLIDQAKLPEAKRNIANVVTKETNNTMSGYAVKGFQSANTDAEVFAQNLADKLFSTPIDIPEIDQLFKAPSGGDKGKDSKEKTNSLLGELIQSSEESNVLLREGIQKDRANLDRLSGDKFINESSSQSEGDPTPNKIEGLVNELKGFGASFNKDFSDVFDTRLKDLAVNASKAVGVPDTGWIDNITNFVQYLDVFANLLKVINPELADSFGNVRKSVTNDSVRFASQGIEGIARKGRDLYNQVQSNPNLQKESLETRINQGKDFLKNKINQGREFIGNAKNRAIGAIPPELISQGREFAGAAKNRVMEAIPPELISLLQNLQQQLKDIGAIDTLRAVLEKTNQVGGQLIATIGQLINTVGNIANTGEAVPAVKDFLGNVQTEISTRTANPSPDSLFRADTPPDIWDNNLKQTSPEFAFDAPDVVSISPLNTMGNPSMDFPDPWGKPQESAKRDNNNAPNENNNEQNKVQVDLATFIQKSLPIAIAGLVAAKLGTSLLNNVLPGKSNIERKVSVDSLQSTLTKALIGAVTVAVGQKLAPQLSKFFTPDKNVTLSERIKSIFSKPTNVPPELPPTPYANLSSDELAKLIAGLGGNNSLNTSSLDNSGFLPLERMNPLGNLYRGTNIDKDSNKGGKTPDASKSSETKNNNQDNRPTDLLTFIQKSLPIAVAGLVVAKLGTSLLNNVLPGKSNVERKDSVNNLQSTLTKALIGAVTVALGQKLVPQLSKAFKSDKVGTLSDRGKSIFSNLGNIFPKASPVSKIPSNIKDDKDEWDKVAAAIDNLFRATKTDKTSSGNSGTSNTSKSSEKNNNNQDNRQADSPTFIQKSLPIAIAGLVATKLGTSLVNNVLPGKRSVERKDSVNNLQSILTKALIGTISVANLTNAPLLPKKEDIPDISKLNSALNSSNLPKAIGVAVAAALSARLIGSTVKSIRSGDRQESLGEKLTNRLINQNKNRGRQIDEKFAGYSGKKRTSGENGDIPSIGIVESLLSKLPILLTSLIIGRLIADVVPRIADESKKGSSDSSIDSVDLSQKSSMFGSGIGKTNIEEVINPQEKPVDLKESARIAKQQKSVDLKEAARLAKEMTKDSGLPKQNIKAIEKDFIDLYMSNPQAFRKDETQTSGEKSAKTENEQLAQNFKAIADEIFKVSGLNPTKIEKAGLFPGVTIDSENKLKGASAYSIKDNQVTLSADIAKMLSSSEGISKEAFTTIAHELRHAIQLSFGKQPIGSVAAMAQEKGVLQVGKNSTIDLKTQQNLIDPSKAEQLANQTEASLAMNQPTNLSKGIEALEIDAEVFAQNLADIFYGLSETVPEILPRADISNSKQQIDSNNVVQEKSISSLDKEIKNLGKTYKSMSSQEINPNLASLVTIDVPDITSANTPSVLDAPLPATPTELLPIPDPTISLSAVNLNNLPDQPFIATSADMGDSGQLILQAIKVSIERILVLLDNIAAQLGASINPELNLDADSMSTIENLYRGVTDDRKKPKKEKGAEQEKARAVVIGERIGTKFENAIDNVQSRLNKKMQDAGMSEDDIRGLADQAGGYMFANLSAFFPAGAIGVAFAPVIASLSALGIPIAAAVNQLAPLGQMMVDTMRTMAPIQTRFETIGGSPEKGSEMMNFAEQIAQQYNTPLLASMEGYSRLVAASKGSKLEGQDTEELFKGVSQAMAALGLNAQDASLIFLAFQQVISKGKVAAEELRGQIGERLPGAIQLAAKSMGMSVKEFTETLDRGEISSSVLIPKLAKAFQEEYGAGAKAASNSFLGTLNKIENSLFNFRRLMTDEFGGIVAGIARTASMALDAVLWLMDNVLLKSGLMFNAIVGIQAQIIAGTAFIFSKLDIPMALAKALSGSYGKMSLVLIPFVFGLFQEIIGTILAKIFGVEIDNAVQILIGFFSTVVGRIIQMVIDLSKDPKQVMEGMVNIARSIAIGVKSAAEAFLNFGIAIQTSIGLGVDQVTWLISKLGEAERLVNKLADSTITKIYAPKAESSQSATPDGASNNEQGMGSIFNGKAIARTSLEFFGLFAIAVQTMVLLRIVGEQALKAGIALKEFGGKFRAALLSMKTGKSILSMLTLGFSGLNLALAALATLVILMAFKSTSTNSFLTQLSNSVKALEGLNKNLDNLANKKIDIQTRITQLDQEGVRDTPFQDKGINLTFWRTKDQEKFTTDDIIRRMQKQIDSTAYRRDLPLLPNNFSDSRGSLFDQGNLMGLGNVLSSQVGQQNKPTSFDELISLKDKLAEERKVLEDYLSLNLQLDATNTFDELTKLKSELRGVDNQLAAIQKKRQPFSLPGAKSSLVKGLNQRKAELQTQINPYEQQRALTPGSDTMIGLTPLEAQRETLKQELKTIDNQLNNYSFGTLGQNATSDSFVVTNKDKLLQRRESIVKSLEELDQTLSASVDDLSVRIGQKTARVAELSDGKTREEKAANRKEISGLLDEAWSLFEQRNAILATNARDRMSKVNQDVRAIEVFVNMPGVFNNAFNQDDTVLREMVLQQLDVFSMVQDKQINPQRLAEGNLVSVLPELQRDVQKERDLTANRIGKIEEEIAQLDITGEGAQEKLAALNKELKFFNNRLVGLKGLNRFLDISQSYADLGAGKQELQNTRITRSLTRLSEALKNNPVQSEALQQFQQTPTLPNLAQLEQSILIDLVPAQQAVTRAKSERENIATTPMLRTEKDLRSAGYVTKEQKVQLDVFRALEDQMQRDIQSARQTVTEAYSDYNQATAEGLDFRPALDNYYAVGEQLKELQTQLQNLRAERDKFLDEVKTVAPPIQVDDKAREQRLAQVDQAIKEAEYKVNELAKQYQLIQQTKSGLGGLGQLGENLDVAADKLREPLKGFAGIWERITSNRSRAANNLEVNATALNPALETVGGFINQQQNLSPGARAGLVGGLNSGDYVATKTVLESINIQDGKIFFNGEELTGTNEEIASFTKALKTASRVLDFIGNQSNKGSKPVKQAIEESFGIQTVDTQRAEISNRYFAQITSLATSGIFSDSQLKGLTQDGLKLADAQKILDEVKNRDGLTNFQSVIQTLQDQGASEGEIRDVLNTLTGLEQTFVDALALDPRGSTKVRLGTVGEEEYTQTIGKLDQIAELAFKASEKIGLQYYDGNINTWMNALKDVKPDFLANIEQLRTIESDLTRIGQKRTKLNEQLSRTDLTKDQRFNLKMQSIELDTQYRDKYREKKVAGADLVEAGKFFQDADAALSKLAEDISKSDLAQEIKDSALAQIKDTRSKYIVPGLDAFNKGFGDLISLSGEEALEAAGKALIRALENFEKAAKEIDAVTSQKLADITTAILGFSSNKELAITDFNKSVAGLAKDPEKIAAEQNLAIAQVNAQQSLKKLDVAQKTKEDANTNYEIVVQKAAFSPIEFLPELEKAREKQIEALGAFSQAQEEYSQNIKALTEAQLAKIEADTQVPVRISQFNSRQKNIAYKQQQLDGVLKESDVRKLQLQDEIGLLDIEIASTAAALESIAKDIEAGYITNIDVANEKISALINKQQDLVANRLDKLLEKENEEREQSIKLLENQSSLSAKYFDVAINGYELLNKETERYTKQLDNLTQVGEQLKSLSQSQFQFEIGRGETKSSLIDAGVGARERLSAEDISPRERAFQQRRLSAIATLGNQSYGIQPAAFGMNEDAALAEQQKIATKLAKEKLDAMEKEQAIAAKLLDIEIQRNQIAAEMAVREAEIGKLRAEQALIQAQFGLQQAILGKDPTAIKLAELEVKIAASQQGVADAELGAANENLALQELFAQMQREAFKLDSASDRDGLIAETAGNQNVDLGSILQSLQEFKKFDPTKANPREVFAPYLDFLNKQTPQQDSNTNLAFPDIATFNGDFQAWANANLTASTKERSQLEANTPPEVKSLQNVFNKIFGEPVASKIDMSNGKVQDISKEIAILNAGRLGEKVAPTQEMINSVSGQREIDNALDQARRLAQASEPVDNSRMASDVYAISADMADAMSTFLTIAELLGLIAINTRTNGVSGGGNNPNANGQPTPPGIEDGGNAYDDVKTLIEQLAAARGIRDVLEPIVNDTKTNKPFAAPLSEILPAGQTQSNPLDLSESILPAAVNNPAPIDQQSALPPTTKVSAILNPTIQNSVTPRFAAPAVNVSTTVAQREPGYFYRNLANEVTPQIAYRVPPGVQATQGATSYPPVQNTTINITNKIDAASQREMYAKIGETQTKAVLSALNKMA